MNLPSRPILIVDDDPINREILSQYMGQFGHHVNTAENGKIALEMIQNQAYDLILLDIMMPEMNGFQVLESLKQDPNLYDIPVVIISALDSMHEIIKAIELGAEDYLTKPFNRVLLKTRVDTSLEKKLFRDTKKAELLQAKKETEVALEISDMQLQAIISSAPLILFVFDRTGKIRLLRGKDLERMHINPDSVIGSSIFNLWQSQPGIDKQIQRALKGENFSATIRHADFVWEVKYTPSFDETGDVDVVIGVATDITMLEKSHARLKALSTRLLDIQEKERREIARELHDEIGQSLTGLKISLEMGVNSLPSPPSPFFKEAKQLTNDLVVLIREMSLNLRPSMLDDLGILSALLWYFDRYTARTHIRVNFTHSGLQKQRFQPQIETTLYRIVQEALTNIARYAEVDQADVNLHAQPDKLLLEISDQGAGFDLESVLSLNTSNGLAGMQERATLLDGEISINSEPERGTQILVSIPYKQSIQHNSAGSDHD